MIPRWAAIAFGPVVFLAVVPLVHGVLPWAVSLLGPRYGWLHGVPAIWNLLGLLPVTAGALVLLWLFVLGMSQARALPDRVSLDWSPKLLIIRGPYAFSRHPMYLAEAALWLGWSLLYGSVFVLLGLLLLGIGVTIMAAREEQALESKFGEAYRLYQARVPQWFGRPLARKLSGTD